MIVGLGALTVGGGAVFGSGAFSSTEATRSLQVNVIDESDIAEEFLDVVIDVGAYDSIGIGDGGTQVDGGTLFPTNGDTDYNQDPGFSGSEVSLIDNDVTVVFGSDDEEFSDLGNIAGNTTVTYDDLFVMVNDNASDESPDFTVTFDFITDDTNYTLSFEDGGDNAVDVNAGTVERLATTELAAGDGNDGSGELQITIEEQSA